MDAPQEQAGLAWQIGVWNRISDVYLREIDRRFEPVVEPRGFTAEADGRVAVTVHQVVRDLAGKVLKEDMVQHVYAFEGGLVTSMEIRHERG